MTRLLTADDDADPLGGSGGFLVRQAGYSRIRTRLSAPPGAPGHGGVFALPNPQW